jgi:dipeptidyl aminopeptidase/acylaminoacyl peptidase
MRPTDPQAGAHHHQDPGSLTTAPYGSWRSSINLDLAAAGITRLGEPRIDAGAVYWIEGRPAERGRQTLVRHSSDGVTRELTPAPFRVGDKVHEYGGGSYLAERGRVIVSSTSDGRLFEIDPEGLAPPRAITPEGPWRYADLALDVRGDRLYAVRETHDVEHPDRPDLVVNELVTLAINGSDGAGRAIVTGLDFVAAPRPSPDGRHLAWLEWDHPNMPWDAVRLRVAPLTADGALGPAATVAGGPTTSIAQPEWSPSGVLHYVSDESGWWNLFACDGPDGACGTARNLAPMEAELAGPAWVFAQSSYDFAPGGRILAVARSNGRDELLVIDPGGSVHRPPTPFSELSGLRVEGDVAVASAAGPHDAAAIVTFDAETGRPAGVLARALATPIDPAVLPHAEAIEFPTSDGQTARALYFPPTNSAYRGPDGELPPLIVDVHGGPTSCASSSLSPERAFFTSRGIAYVDVDYRGSTGYGRPYRDALKSRWGIVDVEDSIAAARFLADRGSIDPRRMAIRGGSAGGYTVLAALTFRPEVFAAGISHFGIADLELIHEDGHKFESRYDEGLLAPWPEGRSVFRERSPIHALHEVRVPLLIFQGLDDRVVPPSQVDAMETVLHDRGVPHAIMQFEGEGHGFRQAETHRSTYAAELSFLGQVFGFEPADEVPPLEIRHLR